MSSPIHYIAMRVFAEKGETNDIKKAIERILPEDVEDKTVFLEQEEIAIDENTTMTVLRTRLTKSKHIRSVLKVLKETLGAKQCETVASQPDRVDEKGALYIRIDKRSFVAENKAELVDHGSCIHFKLMLAAHPKTRENAILIAKKLFSEANNP